MNLYTHMAHYVAKILHMRPNDILDGWGVAELEVAYGTYANEKTEKEFREWKSMSIADRRGKKAPKRYAVKFHCYDDIEDE